MSTYKTTAKDGTEVIITGADVPIVTEAKKVERVPSNVQINSALSEVQSAMQEARGQRATHQQGTSVLDATEQLLGTTSSFINEKNRNERWQRLYLLSRGASSRSAGELPEGWRDDATAFLKQVASRRTTLRTESDSTTAFVRDTIYNLITSADFRSLTRDFFALVMAVAKKSRKDGKSGDWEHEYEEHGYTSGEHGYTHGEHGLTHGEHGYTHGQQGFTHGEHGYTHGQQGFTHGEHGYTHGQQGFTQCEICNQGIHKEGTTYTHTDPHALHQGPSLAHDYRHGEHDISHGKHEYEHGKDYEHTHKQGKHDTKYGKHEYEHGEHDGSHGKHEYEHGKDYERTHKQGKHKEGTTYTKTDSHSSHDPSLAHSSSGLEMPPVIPDTSMHSTHIPHASHPTTSTMHAPHSVSSTSAPIVTTTHSETPFLPGATQSLSTSQAVQPGVCSVCTAPGHGTGFQQQPISSQHLPAHVETFKSHPSYTRSTHVSEAEIEDIRHRLDDFLDGLRQNPEHRRLFLNFLNYAHKAMKKAGTVPDKKKDQVNDFYAIVDEGYAILGDFIGPEMARKYRKRVSYFIATLNKDKEIDAWGHDSRLLLLDLVEHPEDQQKEAYIEKVRLLIQRGRYLLIERGYSDDMQRINDDTNRIFERIKSDPLSQDFRDNLSTLGRSFVMNPSGEPDLFVLQQSLDEIKNLLIVIYKRALADISFEKIQVRNPKYDVTLKEIKLNGHEFAPKRIRVGLSTDSVINFSKAEKSTSKYTLRLSVDKLRPELKDFKFEFKKKTFPSVRDHGSADVLFTGNGMNSSVLITLTAETGQHLHAHLSETTVHVDPIKINVGKDAKHDFLDSLLAPMVARTLTSRLQTSIKTFLEERLSAVLHQLNEFFASKPLHRLAERGNVKSKEMYTSRTEKSKSEEKAGKHKVAKPKRKQSAGAKLTKKPVGTTHTAPVVTETKHKTTEKHVGTTAHPVTTEHKHEEKHVEKHHDKGKNIAEPAPKREALA